MLEVRYNIIDDDGSTIAKNCIVYLPDNEQVRIWSNQDRFDGTTVVINSIYTVNGNGNADGTIVGYVITDGGLYLVDDMSRSVNGWRYERFSANAIYWSYEQAESLLTLWNCEPEGIRGFNIRPLQVMASL